MQVRIMRDKFNHNEVTNASQSEIYSQGIKIAQMATPITTPLVCSLVMKGYAKYVG